MLAFISFLLVIIGAVNWFCIGILQYDFVAGLFGSQSNVFSRLIYTLVGIASIIVTINLIQNKGKFVISFKKASKEYKEYMNEKKEAEKERVLAKAESGKDFSNENKKEYSTESSKDFSNEHSDYHKEEYSKDKECECGKDCDCKDCNCPDNKK